MLITNGVVDKEAAEEINKIFFEVIIAPDYDVDALEILGQKKNRIILVRNLHTVGEGEESIGCHHGTFQVEAGWFHQGSAFVRLLQRTWHRDGDYRNSSFQTLIRFMIYNL